MTRKIPTRKHLGVKDPLKQRKEREDKLKKEREAPPPQNPDDEPLPRKLQEINRLRQLVKDGKFIEKKKKRKKKKKVVTENVFDHAPISTAAFLGPDDVMTRGMKRADKQVPTIQQRPGESDKAFLHRANMLCDQLIKETKYEQKYKVDIVRNQETGLIEGLKKQQLNEVDEMMKAEAKKAREAALPKKKRMTKKKQAEMAAAKADKAILKKNHRKVKQLKILDKKLEKSKQKIADGFPVRESIKFGEVADRPPEFKVRPRKAIAEKNVKDIMFNQMLIQGKLAEEKNKTKTKVSDAKSPKSKTGGKVVLTGKRKDLPAGERRIIEAQQKSAVAAYRLMKAKKAKAKEAAM